MEAKDTIMSDKELSHFGADNIPMPEGGQTLFLNITLVLEKQAEISFKAGIKEVVEWIKERDCGDKSCVAITIDDWQAKLKEWGIE